MADLLPILGHLPIPFVMGYDTRSILTLDEKEKFLNLPPYNNYYLFLEYHVHNEIITVKHTKKDVLLINDYNCNEIFN
jgi:hypothetical protein